MNKKVLVMGGNGFIGRNVVNELLEKGFDVEIYDLYATNNDVVNHVGNVLTDDHLDDAISGCDAIVYLITSVSPKKSMEFPAESYTQDIPMLLKVLDTCTKHNCKRVVFASSGGTVYGDHPSHYDLKEDEISSQPINHYAICKLACEKILMLYNKLHGMENVILRIANPYGIGQRPESGVGVITTFADKIIKGEEILVYGDGGIIRDFVSVNKVKNAFYKSLIWQYDSSITPIFNVGSGIPLSVNDIIRIISQTLEVTPNVRYLEGRNFDVKRNVLNMEKSKQYLQLEEENEVLSIIEYVKEMKQNYYKK